MMLVRQCKIRLVERNKTDRKTDKQVDSERVR
jgi:hypothetical protein